MALIHIVLVNPAKILLVKVITTVSLKKKMIILRSGNIIGGGDWGKNRLMFDIIKGLKNKKCYKN